MASIELARAESIRRGEQVFLCRAESTTSTGCSAAGDWADGWVVWTNVPNTVGTPDDAAAIDDNDRLQVQGSLGGSGSRAVITLSSGNTLTFFPDGRVAPAVNITVAYPSVDSPQSVRCIRLVGIGSVTTSSGACPS